MWEENQNMQQPQLAKSFSPYKSRLKQIAENRKLAKQSAEDSSMEHLSASAEELDRNAYNTSNENLAKNYKKNSQMAAVAYMVKYAAKSRWEDWSDLTTVSDIMSRYFDLNPEPEVAQRIKEFVNSDKDPEPFWVDMGWIETDEQDESLNWLERIYRDIKHPADLMVQWSYDLVGSLERKIWETGYADAMAIDDYAYRKYGKVIADMTEDEIARLELDLELENAKNWTYIMWNWDASYNWVQPAQSSVDRQRWDVASVEIALWTALEALELAYPGATVWITSAAETPILNLPIQLFWRAGNQIWNLLSLTPRVNTWIKSLPEDVQEEVKSLWGMLLLWKLIGLWTIKNWEFRPWVKNSLKKISENEIIWNIMDYISNKTDWIYDKAFEWAYKVWEWTRKATDNLWNAMSEFANSMKVENLIEKQKWKKFIKNLEREELAEERKLESASRIINPDRQYALKERSAATRTLERLWKDSVKWVKKTSDLYNVIEDSNDMYSAWQRWIYSMDKRRYKPWDSRYFRRMRDAETWIEATPQLVDPFWNWINALKRIYKNNRDILQQLDIIEKKWIQKWLTRADADTLAKMIAEWAKIYKEWKWDMFTAEYIQEIEQIRRDLKDWAREPFKDTVPGLYKVLEYIDSAWSDNLNTQALLRKEMNNQASYKSTLPRTEQWQKAWGFLAKTWQSKWKNVTRKIFNNEPYNPITRELELKKNLDDFFKEDSNIERSDYEWIIRDWYDKNFRDVVDPEWTSYNAGEWEVIYKKRNNRQDLNNYLEDIVEVIEDTELERENVKAIENAWEQLKSLWLSDAEIAEVEKAINAVIQPSFFGEETVVAKWENWVLKKAKKNNK